jgi:hypothetical protein
VRLSEFAHTLDVVMEAVPVEHRLTLLQFLVAGYDEATGARKHRAEYQHVAILCEDCPSLATKACETCAVVTKGDK